MDMDGDSSGLISIAVILLLLFGAAWFAVSETAFASVSRVKLKLAAEHGDSRAKTAIWITEHFDQAITTILICDNILHLATASYVTVLVTRRWGVSAVTVSTIVTTIVVFFAGEMLPKSIGKKYSERFSLGTAGPLRFFMRLFRPLAALLTAIGGFVAKLTRGDGEVTVTEDELYDIIETMTDEGELDESQGELVNRALGFGEVTVESILTARVDLTALDVDWPQEKILGVIRRARHSRLPVYEGSIDNIIGILQIRKYIKAWLAGKEGIDLRSLLDSPYFIHQSANIDELLPVMSAKKLNMAVVTDNYGGTLGVVTIEDIVEQLVGEIWDEEDLIVETSVKNPDGSYSFDASVDIEDAFDFMDWEDPSGFDFGHKLLGEWTYEQFDELPAEGDSFDYNGLRVTVEQLDQRRIRKLRIAPAPAPEGEEART
ncbi:MAG: HlyC/CorC family transporter [Oscillospiraceae bacterium]|nr:HlyC/CorC family transporter [Oscillospiraceae bacterium]